ncbi:MAG: sodium:solute symporter, partial [Xanthobacteraceae bacterium]
GWAAGILWGTWTAWSNGLKPLATLSIGGTSYVFYVGLGALILNVAFAIVGTLAVGLISPRSATARS